MNRDQHVTPFQLSFVLLGCIFRNAKSNECSGNATDGTADRTLELARKHRVPAPELMRAAASALREYAWPGNIRELRNVVERLCLLRSGKPVRVSDLPLAIQAAAPGARESSSNGSPTLEVKLDQPLDETVDRIIEAAVLLEQGNRSRAARRLGIGLRTVQRRLRKGDRA
jgi:DNA-binding NtrC family response regulator